MLLGQAKRGLNEAWRYLVGLIVTFSFYFLGQLPLYGVMYWRLNADQSLGLTAMAEFEKNMDFTILGIDKNVGFLLLIFMFVFALAGLYLVITALHKKNIIDYITTAKAINYRKVWFGFSFWMALSVLIEGINYGISPDNYMFRWNPGSFFPLLFIAIVFLPIQTTFEELFFRGYIMQGISVYVKKKWVPVLLTSIFFGLVHGSNPEVARYGFWTMQFYYILAGLFLAFITVMDDSLELAIGIHAAVNIFGATLFTYEGSVLQTDSIFVTSKIEPWIMILGFIVSAAFFIAICYKKYRWQSWENLMDDIDSPSAPSTADDNQQI
jgi:membrane protease YdiL (CAAX protease family)